MKTNPFANPVYPMIKEVRITENPDVIIELLSSGDWVALNAVNDRGVLKLMLGRVNPSSEARAELKRRLRPCCHDLQQYPE